MDGKWSDSVGLVFQDAIILSALGSGTGTRNVQIRTKNKYPQSTGTATYKLAFKFGEGLSATFPLYVQEQDLGYFEK